MIKSALILQMIFGGALIVVGAFGPILIKESYDKIRKQSAISKLDGFSLGVLERINGLMFADKYFDPGTVRYLLNLEIIKSEVFPSTPITYGYYLTEEGRRILTEKMGRKLYPAIFCDLYNTHWWGGYQDKFIEKKKELEKAHGGILYDQCWKTLVKQFKNNEPEVGDYDLYLYNTPYETVMNKIVDPWQREVEGAKR